MITYRRYNFAKTATGVLWVSIEQSMVIILGSVPILPALSKLDISLFRNLTASITSLVDTRSSQKHGNGSTFEFQKSRFAKIGEAI